VVNKSFSSPALLTNHLHTAARRFALDGHARWTAHYQATGASERPDSVEALAIFPRYLVHEAMLWALEAEDVPHELPKARERLADAVLSAHSVMTRNLRGTVELQAMAEERHALERFIRTVPEGELARVVPLPFRRVLTVHERVEVEQALAEIWGIADGYWYPLEESQRTDVLAFEATEFHSSVGAPRLRSILHEISAGHLFELPEFSEFPAYEQDLEVCDFRYTGAEGYWFDRDMAWIVYASHEDSITFGGSQLVERIQAIWPTWQEHLWQ
jgi:hypothetical protein